MATKALPPGTRGGRVLFGALAADGWSWAALKAFFWFVVIIILIGYLPDRAYYLTVGRTVEVDFPILLWSPVNLCPAENVGLPCPAPVGAVVPWQGSPQQVALPAARTNGAAVQLGSHLVYIGGSDGKAATATTYVTTTKDGNIGAWTDGPALPEARSDAAVAALSGTAYLIGGSGPDGKPTNTIWALPTKGDKADLGTWADVKGVTLPEARSGAMAIAVTDGIVVAGGRGPDGTPSSKVWKSTFDAQKATLGAFKEQAPLVDGVANASISFSGEFIWVYGGTDAKGPVGAVQRGFFGTTTTPDATPPPTAAPGASAAPVVAAVQQWAISNAVNLPAARTSAAGFTSNGTLYLVGGSDGTAPKSEMYWAIPDTAGNLSDGWHHLDTDDLPTGGLAGSAPVVSGSTVLLIGGTTQGGVVASSARASLAPQPPFFQLGLFGVVIPALQIPGEIGQQLGYLAAAGVSTVDFVLLVLAGWAFNHRPQIRAWVDRRRGRR